VVPEGTARSRIMSPVLIPGAFRTRFSTVIRSGVFDAGRKCLLGIMSRKFQGRPFGAHPESELKDIAKYFVPASTIHAFIPTEYRI
jgi:hypothetical protein